MEIQELKKHIHKIFFESFPPAEQPSLKHPVMPKPDTPQNWESVIGEEEDAKPVSKLKPKPVFKTKKAEKILKPFEK